MKKRKRTYLDGVALGMFIATLIFLCFFLATDFFTGDKWFDVFTTFVVSAFTIAAAMLALRGTQAQITQAVAIDENKRLDELAARRAMLPFALSEFCAVAENKIRHRFDVTDIVGHTRFRSTASTVSTEAINVVRDCIQVSDPASRRYLSELLASYQVMMARTEGERQNRQLASGDQAPMDHNLTSEIINWATLYAIAECAFPFARGEARSITEFQTGRIYSALFLAGIMIENFPRLSEHLQIKEQSGRWSILSRASDLL